MIEVFVAFAMGAAIPTAILLYIVISSARQVSRYDAERAALIDRIQSPDLASYYGARSAWHPEEYPAPPAEEYHFDDFGFVQDRKLTPGILPGEQAPDPE